MTNINLVTQREEGGTMGKGVVALFVTALIVSFVYIGLIFYGKKIDDDTKKLALDYESKQASFVAGETVKVLDFQNRLILSSELLAQKRTAVQDMEKVEEAIIPGVYLGSYSYNDANKTISLNCYASNYETIAKQLLSFKSSDYFSSVLGGESSPDTSDSNRIGFSIVLTIK